MKIIAGNPYLRKENGKVLIDLVPIDDFLGKFETSEKRRLAGRDSRNNVYFIENEPFPRVIRSRIVIKDKI